MVKSKTLSFADAIAESEELEGGRSVLLGNGFSIDWDPATFHYASLFDEAKLAKLSVEKTQLFDSLSTRDFERVIELLSAAATLTELYDDGHPDLAKALRADARVVQHGLAEVLASRHPDKSTRLSDAEAVKARRFLSYFGRIFTLNYDLLLYWVLNRDVGMASPRRGDGFEWQTASGGPLTWKKSAARRGQRVFYLHGALHYFVNDRRLNKVKAGIGDPLVDQIRELIEDGKYPLVVTEGTTEEKQQRIERSGYLQYSHDAFRELTGALFVHGVSMSPNDEHVFSALEDKASQVTALYVGLHAPRTRAGRAVKRRAEELVDQRRENGGRRLTVKFYDPATARVWR